MAKARITIVDDDKDLVEILKVYLDEEGYQVTGHTSPVEALKSMQDNPPDLALLDVRMKEMDGLDLCRRIKEDAKTKAMLVIILSVRDDVSDVVAGLEVGAEDYIRKPVQKPELLARVRTVIRRKNIEPQPEKLVIGPLEIDFLTYKATVKGQVLDLRPKEFELLAYLARREGQLVTRQSLAENVWGRDHLPTSNTIEFHMYRLRQKLGDNGEWIKGFRGVGYRFEVE